MKSFETAMMILTIINVFAIIVILGINSRQLVYLRKELRLRTVLDMASSNREIILAGINNPHLFECLRSENGEEGNELLSRYAQLWINLAHTIWYQHKIGLLEEAEWRPVRDDILNMFTTKPHVKQRWEKYSKRYSKGFRSFVDKGVQPQGIQPQGIYGQIR